MQENTQEINQEVQDIEYPILNIEEPEYCKMKVNYKGDPEVVKEKLDEAIATLRKLQVPGFRKGKAPDYAIKARLKPQINQHIAREMASQAIDDIVFQTDAKIIGMPSFSNVSVKGTNFSCDIELNKKPEFELQNIKYDIPKPAFPYDEEVLAEKSLLNLRIRMGTKEPYDEDDVVEIGDQITFSFEGTIDGEAFDGSVVEGEMYTVGSDRWGGFDDKILGMKPDETREFDLEFENGPEDILGKTAHFKVDVHMGMKTKPHDLDEEFCKTMGVENIEEVMSKLRGIARTSLEKSKNDAIRNQAAIRLVEDHKFDIPEFMTLFEAQNIASQMGVKWNDVSDEDRKGFLENAEKSVRLSLVLDSIRQNEPDAVLNDSEAQSHLAQHLASQGQDPNKILGNKAMRPQVISWINKLKDEFALQWVASQANIVE